jgi:hypothetical protein
MTISDNKWLKMVTENDRAEAALKDQTGPVITPVLDSLGVNTALDASEIDREISSRVREMAKHILMKKVGARVNLGEADIKADKELIALISQKLTKSDSPEADATSTVAQLRADLEGVIVEVPENSPRTSASR